MTSELPAASRFVMPAKVTLTVADGKLRGQQFVFADCTTCIVGRAEGIRI
jgi:hypothetical protein